MKLNSCGVTCLACNRQKLQKVYDSLSPIVREEVLAEIGDRGASAEWTKPRETSRLSWSTISL